MEDQLRYEKNSHNEHLIDAGSELRQLQPVGVREVASSTLLGVQMTEKTRCRSCKHAGIFTGYLSDTNRLKLP